MIMVSALKQNWWVLVLRGIIAIAFGIVSFIWPGVTALALVFLLAAFAFVEGIFALIGACSWCCSGCWGSQLASSRSRGLASLQ